MKNKLAAILISGAFALGANCSDDLRQTKSMLNGHVSETGYERPYSIRIITVQGRNGIETYLSDPVSGKSKRILRDMELEQGQNYIDSILEIYNLFMR